MRSCFSKEIIMNKNVNKINVIMLGPDIDVKGGISFVIKEYLRAGLGNKVNLVFIPTHKDGSAIRKIGVFIRAFFEFIVCLFQAHKPIVHLHISQKGSFFRKLAIFIIAKMFHKKTLIHIHGSQFNEFMNKNRINKSLTKFMFEKTDKIIVLSAFWKDIAMKVSVNKNVSIIYNPVAPAERNKKESTELVVLFLGRLGRRKGIYDLLDCITLNKSYFDEKKIRFILGGDGDVDDVGRFVKEKGLESIVTVPGWISGEQKEKYLKTSDIFILPSYNEQMPMSILEGMAYGYPIIATVVGGIPEMVKHGENGFLFKSGDIEEMTKYLKLLCENKDMRERMGQRSREIVLERFDSKVIVEELINVYEKV